MHTVLRRTSEATPPGAASDAATPAASTSNGLQGNLPSELNALTQRAIEANPLEAQRRRSERENERQRVRKLNWQRKGDAKRAIELKKRAKQSDAEQDSQGDGTKTPDAPQSAEGDNADVKEPDSLATDLRRRMGFSNPGRQKRDHKRALRVARLAAGGELTHGEQKKLAGLQARLQSCKKRRQRMVPWDKLSKALQTKEFFRTQALLEKRRQTESDRKEDMTTKSGGLHEANPSPPLPLPSSPAPPSASFDESLSSVVPSPEALPIIHHGSRSPYAASTAPTPVIPSPGDVVEEVSKVEQAQLDKQLRSQAAEKGWAMRRSSIDREIRDLEIKISGYLPPAPDSTKTTRTPTKGPDVPKPEQRDSPPLLTQFVNQLPIREGKGKGKEVEKSSTEEAAEMLLGIVNEANERRDQAEEDVGGSHGHRRGRISPRMEREERLKLARSRPYRDHPALQPSSSSKFKSSSAGPRSTEPPRELSSYPHVISPSSVSFSPTPSPLPPVPIAQLSHSLSRALFNPGVHFLRDPRTGVYNFNPEVLENVPKLDEFEFGKLPQYVTSSKDEVLKEVAKREGKTFSGSTSSTVGMLCQIYFWLSKGKPVNTSMLSEPWSEKDRSFSMGQQLPVSVVLNYEPTSDGGAAYSIDADKSFDATSESNVLAQYGHLMEKLLTTEPAEFKRFLAGAEDPAPSEADHRQAYHYAITDNMVLRSQLDAVHEFLPGNGTFDLKTRGTVAIRQDRLNYEESAGYTIDRLRGPWESFEREYYDLIRSAFLKYQFQARIGCMDGIFVAFHSTARFYGFQYLPIAEMDEALFDTHETGKQVFRLAVGMLERLLDEAAKCFEGESVTVTFASDTRSDTLRLFVTPLGRSTTPEAKEEENDGRLPMTVLEVKGTNYVDGEITYEPVVIRPSGNGGDQVPVWQVGYEIKKSTGEEGGGTDSLDWRQIADLFSAVRETQKMFSSLMLPTGVSPKDLKLAAERAKESGVELDSSDLSVRFPSYEGITYRGPSFQAKDLRKMSREGKERTRKEEEERRGERRIVVSSTFDVIE
ncbi:hypothetical protein JCM11491_005876 [Sporobolomyces phaffii]